jgi:hypothetical protein
VFSGDDAAPPAYATESANDGDAPDLAPLAAPLSIVPSGQRPCSTFTATGAALAKMGAHTPRHVKAFASTSYVVKSALDWKQDPKTFVADNVPSWTDTFFVEHEKLAFRRVVSTSARPPRVRIPVDDAKKSMVFAFGSMCKGGELEADNTLPCP